MNKERKQKQKETIENAQAFFLNLPKSEQSFLVARNTHTHTQTGKVNERKKKRKKKQTKKRDSVKNRGSQ